MTQAPSPSNRNGSTSGNGNGNHQPAANAGPEPATVDPRLKIPMDVAFDEVLTWMKAILEKQHIQWNDAAQQDFASTAIIGAQREGWVGPWRRRVA